MRHVFILNPVAGKTHRALKLQGEIERYFAAHPELEYAVRVTAGVGDATRIAAEESGRGEPVRLYACGGDGTLMETANGITPDSPAELTVIPCGSGNDYVRIFGGAEPFFDLPDLVNGTAISVDAVESGGRRSLNIASIGMDAKVCACMEKYKNWPGVSGSMAYQLAIVDVFCHPIGEQMTITIDSENGTVERQGRYLMALAANGQYYGGGFRGAPQAVEDDGVLDFVLVKKIGRLNIPRFLKKYKAGDYDDLPYCEHLRGTRMTVASQKATYCNMDGECTCDSHMTFSLLPAAFRFVIPASVAALRQAERQIIGGAHEATAIVL